jgi:hypothetical protein
MLYPEKSLHDLVEAEFVTADVEIGFNLIDIAEAEAALGNIPLAVRILGDAERVFRDLEGRVQRAQSVNQASFMPLVEELRRKLALVRERLTPA